jgi:hypothetical protein
VGKLVAIHHIDQEIFHVLIVDLMRRVPCSPMIPGELI